MKNLSISFFATFLFLGSGIYSSVHATDWTIPANPGCKVALGNVTNIHSGYKASGGTAVIHCDLTKKVGSNNLNFVYARINRKAPGGADPFCTVNSYGAFSAPKDTTSRFATNGTGNKSISIPLPDIYSSGYLTVGCVLNDGDTMYGIRYGQD